ncbi:MAG: hypothetical protein O6834_07975 [Actinobacteria bacterium]|nr:hypothetical protein [Actinomycetota bacterium]
MTHQLVLSSERVKKPRYHTSDIPEHVHKGDLSAAAMLARMLNSYIDVGLTVDLHVWIRGITGDANSYCAVIEYTTGGFGETLAERSSSRYAHLSISGDDEPPKMHEPVLVLVPEFVEGEQRFGKRPPSLGIRLQSLDECGRARSDTTDHVETTAGNSFRVLSADLSEPRLFSQSESAGKHRKSRFREFRTHVVNSEPVNSLVEGGAKVVDGFAQHNAPHRRNWLFEFEAEQVLGSIRAYFMYELVWLTVLKSPNFLVEEYEVIVRSLDLGPDGLYGSGVNLHDGHYP